MSYSIFFLNSKINILYYIYSTVVINIALFNYKEMDYNRFFFNWTVNYFRKMGEKLPLENLMNL